MDASSPNGVAVSMFAWELGNVHHDYKFYLLGCSSYRVVLPMSKTSMNALAELKPQPSRKDEREQVKRATADSEGDEGRETTA